MIRTSFSQGPHMHNRNSIWCPCSRSGNCPDCQIYKSKQNLCYRIHVSKQTRYRIFPQGNETDLTVSSPVSKKRNMNIYDAFLKTPGAWRKHSLVSNIRFTFIIHMWLEILRNYMKIEYTETPCFQNELHKEIHQNTVRSKSAHQNKATQSSTGTPHWNLKQMYTHDSNRMPTILVSLLGLPRSHSLHHF